MMKGFREDRLTQLRWIERIGYGLGDAGFNFYWAIIGSYLVFFYTDIFGIPAATTAIMVTLTKVVDAVTDPMMGALADRTSTRFGQFRPYILFGALPMMVAGILLMTTPKLTAHYKIVWAYCTYGVMMLMYTVLNTPYNALSGVMTSDSRERSSLNSIRFFFAYLSSIVVGAATPELAKYFGGGDRYSAYGWQLTMTLYASIASVLFLVTFVTTKERIVAARDKDSPAPWQDFLSLVRCKPWLILFLVSMVFMISMTLRSASAPYYMRYFAQRADLLGVYIGVQFVGLMFGALLCGVVTRFIEKKHILMVALFIVSILSTLLSFVPQPSPSGVVVVDEAHPEPVLASALLQQISVERDPTSYTAPRDREMKTSPLDSDGTSHTYVWYQHIKVFWLFEKRIALSTNEAELSVKDRKGQKLSVKRFDAQGKLLADSVRFSRELALLFLLNFLISVALGLKSPITWSMYADVADYNEWRVGYRATGMTFSATTFSQKLGSAAGSAFLLSALAQWGYRAGEMQSGLSLTGIVSLQTIVPGVFTLLTAVVLYFYHLDQKTIHGIQEELQRMRVSRSSGAPISLKPSTEKTT